MLGVTVINNPTKTYNGTTTASLTSANYLTTGLVSGESITFSQPNSVVYDSANAGTRNVLVGFLPSNFTAANGTRLANYTLPSSATGIGTINKAKVQLSGLIGSDKTYDGTTTDAVDKSHASIFGVISGDTADATLDVTNGSGQFADANVGNGKAVTATGFQLVGNKASNYELVLQSDITGSITPKTLTIGGVSAINKSYDAPGRPRWPTRTRRCPGWSTAPTARTSRWSRPARPVPSRRRMSARASVSAHPGSRSRVPVRVTTRCSSPPACLRTSRLPCSTSRSPAIRPALTTAP